MTYLEAIKGKVCYPLSEKAFGLALLDRGLTSTSDYTATSEAFELAYADCLVMLLTSPKSVSESGFSLTTADKETLKEIANGIYSKYEEASPLRKDTPTATFVQKW